jgi:hypothetical protein
MTLDSPPPLPEPSPPVLRFDWRDWLPYFEDETISEAEKRALIETIWSIVIGFVDLGWSIAPALDVSALEISGVREGSENCGQTLDLKAVLEAAVVRSEPVGKGKEAS